MTDTLRRLANTLNLLAWAFALFFFGSSGFDQWKEVRCREQIDRLENIEANQAAHYLKQCVETQIYPLP